MVESLFSCSEKPEAKPGRLFATITRQDRLFRHFGGLPACKAKKQQLFRAFFDKSMPYLVHLVCNHNKILGLVRGLCKPIFPN
jgi:hypothetical protein